MQQFTISKSGSRLDTFILYNCPQLNIGILNKYCRENKIKVNGKKVPLNTRLVSGDLVKLFLPENIKSENDFFDIVFEDDNILLVNKPAGICANNAEKSLESGVINFIKKRDGNNSDLFLCHRLDTGTSGIVIFAKNLESKSKLDLIIKNRELKKEYICITYGVPSKVQDVLKAFMVKDSENGLVYIDNKKSPSAKEIITEYEVLGASNKLALLNITLVTGRTHQIRAHMANINCPILGDSKYGNNSANREYKLKYQALCAYKITFPKIGNNSCLSNLSLRKFTVNKPWYQVSFENGTLK